MKQELIRVEPLILSIRDFRVILDSDLARIYGVRTRVLNQAIKRNLEKFPDDFMFRSTRDETETLLAKSTIGADQVIRSQIVTG